MEINQIIILLVIVVLASVLTAIGIEVFFVFKEFRETVKKVNKVIDDAGVISESVAKPVASFSGFLTGLKSGVNFVELFNKMMEKRSASEKPSKEKHE